MNKNNQIQITCEHKHKCRRKDSEALHIFVCLHSIPGAHFTNDFCIVFQIHSNKICNVIVPVHSSNYVVVSFAKTFSGLMDMNEITAKRIFYRIWTMIDESQVNSLRPSDAYMRR